MVEVESITNSRPLTPVVLDPDREDPLTPNHLLLIRVSPNLPPGDFSSTDIYSRKRWWQVQYLANQFWVFWKPEYLQTMQSRHKWQVPQKNFIVNDVVLVHDEHDPRGKWPLGGVIETYPDKQGHVQVLMRTSTGNIKRPISKLCLVLHKDWNRACAIRTSLRLNLLKTCFFCCFFHCQLARIKSPLTLTRLLDEACNEQLTVICFCTWSKAKFTSIVTP